MYTSTIRTFLGEFSRAEIFPPARGFLLPMKTDGLEQDQKFYLLLYPDFWYFLYWLWK